VVRASWAQRYEPKSDKFEKIPQILARSRAAINRAIAEKRNNEVRVIAIVADAIRNPRHLSGAADSLKWALRNKRPGLPNVKQYIEFLYSGLGELREKRRILSRGKQIIALSFAPRGKLLAAATADELLFFDVDTGKHLHNEKTPRGWPLSLRWSPDATRIYVGTSPTGPIIPVGSIKALSEYVAEPGEHSSVSVGNEKHPAGYGAWSQDGEWIVVAGWQRRASLWDAVKGERIRDIEDERLGLDPQDYMSSDVAVSADGERFALGVASGKIHIFRPDYTDGKPDLRLETSLDAIEGKPAPYSLVFDPKNHNRLLVAYMLGPYMALWKIDEKEVSLRFGEKESGPVWRVAFDPNGELVASATNDAVVRLWTPSDPDSVTDSKDAVQLRGHLGAVFALDISPQNGNIASATFDGTIRFWGKDSPFSPKLLSQSVSMPASSEFSVKDGRISITANGGSHSAELPKGIGPIKAAAVTADGGGIAVVPEVGRPVLLVKSDEQNARATITLDGVKETEWAAVAFDNDTRIMAETKNGRVFVWPFRPDVPSLEQLARDHMRLVEGSEEQLFDLPATS
jgi:WD40 repeat protein